MQKFPKGAVEVGPLPSYIAKSSCAGPENICKYPKGFPHYCVGYCWHEHNGHEGDILVSNKKVQLIMLYVILTRDYCDAGTSR